MSVFEPLSRAPSRAARPAAGLAYRSLAVRAGGDFTRALALTVEALELEPDCLEAHAARAAAMLSSRALGEACLSYRRTLASPAKDLDAHALRLLMTALLAETLAEAREDEDGLSLDFKITPASRCAIRVLDERPRLAVEEAATAENSVALELALGAAFYFANSPEHKREWARAARAFPSAAANAAIRESLLALTSAA